MVEPWEAGNVRYGRECAVPVRSPASRKPPFAARLDTSRADRTIHAAWQPGQNSAADGSCAESVPLVSRDNMGSVQRPADQPTK